jgi:hypothetical protein
MLNSRGWAESFSYTVFCLDAFSGCKIETDKAFAISKTPEE